MASIIVIYYSNNNILRYQILNIGVLDSGIEWSQNVVKSYSAECRPQLTWDAYHDKLSIDFILSLLSQRIGAMP